MRVAQDQIGKQANKAADDHDRGCEPVDRRDPLNAITEEGER